MSIAATQLETVLNPLFPGVRFGRYNCRRIAGSTTWSQHAWPGGNARDIYAPEDHHDPSNFISGIVDWLEANREALSIRLILWQTKDHYGHAHVDFWPHGHDTPPCAGGEEEWEWSTGLIHTGTDPGPENGEYPMDYRGVINVPDQVYARGVVDWGIQSGIIVTGDDYQDDWDRDSMTDGRLWTFLYRFDQYLHGGER